jgi:hypothetical protein
MKIDFQFETKHGMFSDALHFPDDQTPSGEEIEVMKQQRLANWIAIVDAPSQQIVETSLEEGGSSSQEDITELPAQE